jgi:hypothetical protein
VSFFYVTEEFWTPGLARVYRHTVVKYIQNFGRKSDGKTPLTRPRHTQEYNRKQILNKRVGDSSKNQSMITHTKTKTVISRDRGVHKMNRCGSNVDHINNFTV